MKRKRLLAILLILAMGVQTTACSLPRVPEEESSLPAQTDSRGISPESRAPSDESGGLSALLETIGGYRQVANQAPAPSAHYSYRAQSNFYDSLFTQAQRDCYNQLKEEAYLIQEKADEDGMYPGRTFAVKGDRMTGEEIRAAVTAFKDDNPSVFWLSNSYRYYYDQTGEGDVTYIQVFSFLPAEECADRLLKLQEKVAECVAGLKPGMTEYEREQYVHDFVAARCTYDQEALEHQEDWVGWWPTFTAYGALVEGKAVCEGYARSVELLLSYADMSSALVRGDSEGQRHMWNVVKVEGNWYHLDPTWNDSRDQKEYFYFNLSEKQISEDHKLDPPASQVPGEKWEEENDDPLLYNLFLPESVSTGENYFQKEGFRLDSLESDTDELAVKALISAVEARRSSFPILIGEQLDYDETVRQLLSAAPYKFFYYVEQANDDLPPSLQIGEGSLRYVEAKSQRAVVVYLSE